MSDEILFRGMTENGEWVEGYLVGHGGRRYLTTGVDYGIEAEGAGYSPEFIEVIPDTVGQFIVEEEGVRIFEGDKIEVIKHGIVARIFVAKDIRTFIKEYSRSPHDSIFKVFGTIHDKENKDEV